MSRLVASISGCRRFTGLALAFFCVFLLAEEAPVEESPGFYQVKTGDIKNRLLESLEGTKHWKNQKQDTRRSYSFSASDCSPSSPPSGALHLEVPGPFSVPRRCKKNTWGYPVMAPAEILGLRYGMTLRKPSNFSKIQWIGWRETLQETIELTIKKCGFSGRFCPSTNSSTGRFVEQWWCDRFFWPGIMGSNGELINRDLMGS